MGGGGSLLGCINDQIMNNEVKSARRVHGMKRPEDRGQIEEDQLPKCRPVDT